MKVFLDTNVLVSAVAARGLCADVLREVFQSHQLVVCDDLLHEIERTLDRKIGVPDELVAEFTHLLRQDAVEAKPGPNFDMNIRNQADARLISTALSAGADVFVTGDKELLDLAQVDDLEIISPRGFWEKLKSRD